MEFDPNFLSELADKIRALDLEERVSLGNSKKSLGTREMLIAPDATASFTSSSLGNSWASIGVNVLEVGWGFIESANEPGIMVLESYIGHGTSTTAGNHVVLYTSGCSHSTKGLLEQADLENAFDILEMFKKHGWLRE